MAGVIYASQAHTSGKAWGGNVRKHGFETHAVVLFFFLRKRRKYLFKKETESNCKHINSSAVVLLLSTRYVCLYVPLCC